MGIGVDRGPGLLEVITPPPLKLWGHKYPCQEILSPFSMSMITKKRKNINNFFARRALILPNQLIQSKTDKFDLYSALYLKLGREKRLKIKLINF